MTNADHSSANWHRGTDATSLCERFVQTINVTGASLSVIDRAGNQSSLGSTDPVAARIEELQFELGEGPQREALASRSYVLIPDLAGREVAAWPMFAKAVEPLAARALFTLPLLMGAATVGVVSLYNDTPGMLSTSRFREAVALASTITWRAVHLAIRTAEIASSVESLSAPAMRRQIHQATGIVVAQLNSTATVAFARLQAEAFSTGQTLHDVAGDVIDRRLDFRSSLG